MGMLRSTYHRLAESNNKSEDYAQEMSSTGIFDVTFENEHDVLDAVKESECIRNKNFEGESIADCENNITTQTIKKKKKKRFILF